MDWPAYCPCAVYECIKFKKTVTTAPAKLRNERVKVMLACADKDSVQIIRNGLNNSRYQIVQSNSLDVDLYSALMQNRADALILQVDLPDNTLLDMLKTINAKIEIPIFMFATEARSFMVEEVVDAGENYRTSIKVLGISTYR